MGLLDGKVALITGGARGMGAAHVRLFLEEGARVVFGDVLDEEGKALAEETGATYLRHDVTSPEEWERAVGTAVEQYGKLDVLVNNAGILKFRRIQEMSLEDFDRVIGVNLKGTWLGIKAVIEPMKAAGRGSIVNISSIEGYVGAEGLSAYSASKFGVRGVTKSAARELARFKIRVNSVHPGAINTAMALDPDIAREVDAEAFVKSMVIKRFAKPVEVSHVVAFLASDRASYCTGSEVTVDGGLLTGAGY
ncbi:3-alpha-(or 20-beta)-hydroxysteroid dehydrogenase [[Actinomadura] parvosata subsp. kistnae]|uniref:3-alpha-hydroxysteroid dehydrogenase n=1 Tax=[Actinomadura] parvosata subsp. kistnae TaxID=1909395 RepID=A0A1V0A6U7_9ACTN|nr:glucose 1-dehydrogenase [Nonomuraea sp. ATCC 55076]AQZ65923.1 3-alpha-hydroxysteroid dehydrogenase [Nonomuraea sp. ATCC 55076]SPL97378.1 3-alpha-(or 20-beta)-hydroxysteroid dehydrogenase [Actinomadura parvosata subsp. kistnae]